MSCVVIGAGLAGLSSAYFLQKNGFKVTIYHTPLKKTTSAIFVGILYKYQGRWCKKSKFADEGFLASKQLILEVEEKTKRKVILSTGVIKKFGLRLKKHSDVKIENGDGLINEAITVDMREYLQGLKELIGLNNIIEKSIPSLSEIEGNVVIAAGYGIKDLLPLEGLKYLKGQQYIGKKKVEASIYGTIVGRGHISFIGEDKVCLGSSYEAEFEDEEVNEKIALLEIEEKIKPWYGSLEDIKDKEFASGVRVLSKDSYLPIVKKVGEKTYIFTALGSRGLLYHAYYGKILADQVK